MIKDSRSSDPSNSNSHQENQILCFGEISFDQVWILDRIPGHSFEQQEDCHILDEKQGPGGCALNTAVILQAQDVHVSLAGNAIGSDPRGLALLSTLKSIASTKSTLSNNPNDSTKSKSYKSGSSVHDDRLAFDLSLIAVHGDPTVATLFCQVFLDKNTGGRSFALMHRDLHMLNQRHAETMQKTLLKNVELGMYSHFFIQPYLGDLAFEVIECASRSGSGFIVIQDVDPESKFVPFSDCVQISISESKVADFSDLERDLSNFAKKYQRGRCTTVLITLGSRGVFLASKQTMTFVSQTNAVNKVTDTTGCGDAFRAGFLFQLHKMATTAPDHQQLIECIQVGQRFGACKASQIGSNFSLKIV